MSEVLKRPTPAEIDALVLEYDKAQRKVLRAAVLAKGRAAAVDALKTRLIPLVQQFGEKHAEKSMRLKGLHNTATITTGTRTEVVAAGVTALKAYFDKSRLPALMKRFFQVHVSYSLVQGPGEVLKTLKLGKRRREILDALVHGCFDVKTNAPSLKVDVVEPQKP